MHIALLALDLSNRGGIQRLVGEARRALDRADAEVAVFELSAGRGPLRRLRLCRVP